MQPKDNFFDDDDFLFDDEEPASGVRSLQDEEPPSRIVPLLVGDNMPTRREIRVAVNYFSRVPHVCVRPRDLALLPLDHREGFLLSLIDGRSTIETILDVCAMPADEAIAILMTLTERRIIVID